MLVLHAPENAAKGERAQRVLPLGALVLISPEIVRCHTLTKTGTMTLPSDAEPTDARRSALQPAIAALGLEPAAFSVADLKCLLIVATRGAGNQLLLKASSADERREWETRIVEASEAIYTSQQQQAGDSSEPAVNGGSRSYSTGEELSDPFPSFEQGAGGGGGRAEGTTPTGGAGGGGSQEVARRSRKWSVSNLLSPRATTSDESLQASPRSQLLSSSSPATPREQGGASGERDKQLDILVNICVAMEERALLASQTVLNQRTSITTGSRGRQEGRRRLLLFERRHRRMRRRQRQRHRRRAAAAEAGAGFSSSMASSL